MSREALNNSIRSHWATNVATALSIPTQYDNGPSVSKSSIWARLNIRPGTTLQADIGSSAPRHRTPGVVMAQIFDKLEKGDKDLLTKIDLIIPIFRRTTISGVVFRSPYIDVVGRNGGWWQINVVCPFYYDEFES